jgi:hypothetical protein
MRTKCEHARISQAWEAAVADGSLTSTVVGGLLVIGGGIIGLIGTVIRDTLQSHEERRRRRAEKFEELVKAIYEFDHWVETDRTRALGGAAPELSVSPFAKIQAIASLYFPQFDPLVRELDRGTAIYRLWIETANFKRVSGQSTVLPDGLAEAMKPYNDARDRLTEELSRFAQKKFQKN